MHIFDRSELDKSVWDWMLPFLLNSNKYES